MKQKKMTTRLVFLSILVCGMMTGNLSARQYGVRVVVNSKEVADSKTNNANGTPYMNGGTMYVPVRVIAEKLGYKVEYKQLSDQSIGKVIISKGDKKIELVTMESDMDILFAEDPEGLLLDGESSVIAYKNQGVTYVPVRFVSESLGAKVKYECKDITHIAYITENK